MKEYTFKNIYDMTNTELLQYREELVEYGESFMAYRLQLQDEWTKINHLLEIRLQDLQLELELCETDRLQGNFESGLLQ